MNILIFGGGGFLGHNCAEYLTQEHNVVVLDKKITKIIQTVRYFELDLCEISKIIDIIEHYKIDLILHFISTLNPSSSTIDFVNEIKITYASMINILDICVSKNIKIIYCSSGGVIYGNSNNRFISENENRNPINLYGLSKKHIEDLIFYYNRVKNLKYIIIRPSNPYGFGQNLYGNQGLIANIMGKIISNKDIQIWGDGTAMKDYIYIDDFTFYVGELIKREKEWNSIYNIGAGISYSINDILNAFHINDISIPNVVYIDSKVTDNKNVFLNCSKINKLIKRNNIDIVKGINLFWNKLQHSLKES